MSFMRAKMVVSSVASHAQGDGSVSEVVEMRPVYKDEGYDQSGQDENNTFALFTPAGFLSLTINNPALVGKMKQGDTFYLDFSPVDQ